MKYLMLAGLMIIQLSTPKANALPTVIFNDGPGTTGGGEFYAETTANGNFITFCLEASEHLSYNTTYFYEVSQQARYNGTTSTLDPLSRPTAWLYLQFVGETLGTFGSTYSYDHSDADANDLQRAFWYLEGESGGIDNYYAQLAIQQAGAPTLDNNGFYGVGIMNLWANADGTGARQDQLIRLNPDQPRPVPDSGSTLKLLSMVGGVMLLVFRKTQTEAKISTCKIRNTSR